MPTTVYPRPPQVSLGKPLNHTITFQGQKIDLGRCAFSSAAQIWNHIPTAIKVSPSLDSFKRHLKTHYFTSPQRLPHTSDLIFF